MNNDQLISIDDDTLDQVAGGLSFSLEFEVPTLGELLEEGAEAVEGVVDATVEGVEGIVGLFGFSFDIS